MECLLFVKHTLSQLFIIDEILDYRIVVSKFTEYGFIGWQLGKIKFVWVIKPLIGEEYFRFASFMDFIMLRNCTSPILKEMKSFDFLMTDVSCSL